MNPKRFLSLSFPPPLQSSKYNKRNHFHIHLARRKNDHWLIKMYSVWNWMTDMTWLDLPLRDLTGLIRLITGWITVSTVWNEIVNVYELCVAFEMYCNPSSNQQKEQHSQSVSDFARAHTHTHTHTHRICISMVWYWFNYEINSLVQTATDVAEGICTQECAQICA
jgi:hypothetical protein